MEYLFPPRELFYATAIDLVIVAVIYLALAYGLFVTLRSSPSELHVERWMLAMKLFPIVGLPLMVHWTISFRYFGPTKGEFFMLLWCGWMICGVGVLLTQLRLDAENGEDGWVLFAYVILFPLHGVFCYAPFANHDHYEASYRTQCKNNLKQMGLALAVYEFDHSILPPAKHDDSNISWRVAILPQTEFASLRSEYDDRFAWDHPNNATISKTAIYIYQCPQADRMLAERDERGRSLTDYLMLTGPRTVGTSSQVDPMKYENITDGTSNTITIVESSGHRVVWTEPRDIDVSKRPIGVNLSGEEKGKSKGIASSYHRGGAHVLYADGKTRFLSKDIDPRVLKAMTTINGGESVTMD